MSGYIDSAFCQQWVDELYDFEDAKEAVIIAAARNDISHARAEEELADEDPGGDEPDGCTDAALR